MKPRARFATASLVVLLAATTSSKAQQVVAPAAPPHGHWGLHHAWCAHKPRETFPRTFSYQYDLWFNRPRHTRYVGPDGKDYWRTTVRGLPLGAHGPAY